MKKVLLTLLIGIFLIGCISAITWDNVAYYKLDGTVGNVTDEVGSGENDGTNYGATRGVTGKLINAFEYDGSSDYTNLIENVGTNFSVGLWIKRGTIDVTDIILNRWDISQNGASNRFALGFESGSTDLKVYCGSDTWRVIESSLDTSWHYVVMTYDNTTARVYFDNVSKLNLTTTYIESTVDNWTLGEFSVGTGNYNGTVDEVGFWSRVLNRSEISELYNEGDALGYGESPPGENITISSWSTTTFNNSLTTENITFFYGGENEVRYLEIPPSVGYLTEAYFSISSYEGINYQEDADIHNGTCNGAFAVGHGCSSIYDGDWGTYGEPDGVNVATLDVINYSKSQHITNASKWQIKGSDGIENITIAKECYDESNSSLSLYIYLFGITSDTIWRCFDGISPIVTLKQQTSGDFAYEEAMYWNYGNVTNPNVTIDEVGIWNQSGYFNTKNSTGDIRNYINDYLSTCSRVSGYCYVPFNFTSSTPGNIVYSGMYFQNGGIIENSQTYNTVAFETSNETFTLNMSYDSTYWLTSSATLYYNGTIYNGTKSGTGNTITFTTNLVVPDVDSETNIVFYWNVALTNSTGDYYFNVTSHSQTVKTLPEIIITSLSCSAGFFETINFTFADAGNLSSLTADIGYNFKYGIGNLTSNEIYGNFTNISSFRICINETIDTYGVGYGEIDYQSSGYVERRFYLYEEQILSNTTTTHHTLYDLINGDATSFIFEAKDYSLNPYSDYLLSLLRWYPDLNEYKVVEMAKTDEDGLTVMKVKVEDIDYRVGLYYNNGTLIKLASAVRMACLVNPCTYTLSVSGEEEDYFTIYDIDSSLTFDDDLKRFVFIWNDPSQKTSEMRLEVYKDAGYQQILICNSTAEGYSGVLTCSIGNYTGQFRAVAFRTASPEQFYKEFWKTIRTGIESSFGLFFAFIIGLSAGLIGIFSPISAVVMVVLGLIPAVIFHTINLAIFMGILSLAGIVIHYLRKV